MKLISSSSLLLTAICFAAEPASFTVTPDLMAPKPISPRLYSNFIELGYGIQVEPMMSQQFFNRSFEPFLPYKTINIEWFDLWNDPQNPSKGYKNDWTGEDWYHTGYEHNPWFVAPGTGGRLPIDGNSTFIIQENSSLNASIRPEKEGGSGHGVQHLRVINRETDRWAGLGQEGKFLKPGETYHFRGMFRSPGKPVAAEVRFYATGDWSKPIASFPLEAVGAEWSERKVEFKNTEHSGWTTFALMLPPGTELLVDDFSMLPANTYHGWRPEIIEPLKEIGPPVLRIPGGCFASFYDWRDGIGPFSQRKPQPSYFWGGQNYNDVGVAELAMLAKAIGSEVMYCVNVFHPLKRKYEWHFGEDNARPPGPHGFDFPQFTDIPTGAKEAADLVAYCNLPAGSHPMADLRASHGYKEPFGFKYWELDNEVHRWFEPDEYARAAIVYSEAMKAVDPSIKIGLVTYGERFGLDGQPRVHYHDEIPAMLEICGKHIDFLADRGPSAKNYLDQIINWINDYNARNGTSIIYCETEKLFYEQHPDVENRIKPEGGYTKSFMFSKWFYAQKAIMDYMAYQRAGGDIDFVIFNNLANTHSQNVIDTPKEGVFITAAGRAMSQLSKSPAAWPLKFDRYVADAADDFQVSAAWDLEKKRLVLYVLNRTAREREVAFDLAKLGREFSRAQSTSLWAHDSFVMNTLANPDAIRREITESATTAADRHLVKARPWSFVEVIVE
jgi:alpha-L-arabinofuranosidase